MPKFIFEEFAKKLKFMKVIPISRQWPSWCPFDKAFQWSQRLLRWSMTVDWPLF